MPLEPTILLYLALVVFVANTVEAMTGFGATIIAVTLGAQVLPIEFLVPVFVPLNLFLSSWIVSRHHQHIDRPELWKQILPAALVGLPIGYFLFTLAPGRSLEIVFGVFVVLFALRELVRFLAPETSTPPPLGSVAGRVWLLAGGVAQGLYASGGPMVVYYAARTIHNKSAFRVTIATLWLILGVLLTASHLLGGQATRETYTVSVLLLPTLAVGVLLGEWLHDRVSEERFRVVVMVLLLVAGVGLLVR